MFRNFKEYQGPALYAWNDAVFKDEDWHSLAKIEQSSKTSDVLKVGKFGQGFQSVFHITGIVPIFTMMGEHIKGLHNYSVGNYMYILLMTM